MSDIISAEHFTSYKCMNIIMKYKVSPGALCILFRFKGCVILYAPGADNLKLVKTAHAWILSMQMQAPFHFVSHYFLIPYISHIFAIVRHIY